MTNGTLDTNRMKEKLNKFVRDLKLLKLSKFLYHARDTRGATFTDTDLYPQHFKELFFIAEAIIGN